MKRALLLAVAAPFVVIAVMLFAATVAMAIIAGVLWPPRFETVDDGLRAYLKARPLPSPPSSYRTKES